MSLAVLLIGLVAFVTLLACVIVLAHTARAVKRAIQRLGSRSSANKYEADERARMPEEIAQGRLVMNEKLIWRRKGRPIVAKTDQIFRTPQGVLVPVETKARGYVSASDIVQLSVQANILAHQSGAPRVAGWGYLRLAKRNASPFYKRIDLLPPDRIERLLDRWHALREGRATPRANPAVWRCRHCALRTKCPDRRS